MEQAWSHSPAWGWGLPREGLSEPQLCPPRTEAQQEVGSTGPKHQAGWHPQRAEPTPAPLALMEVRFLAATSGGCPPLPFRSRTRCLPQATHSPSGLSAFGCWAPQAWPLCSLSLWPPRSLWHKR